ncbi:protein Iojap-related, mitochondrial isoform X2 [Sesamum indicum]|uniref:Protein Iojap-related, mitochondrial isoform X2 n=1 Tax=Sesamum indicum TaxID=4182 RepID=A0A8M8V087_SESIN|nr:protein Iojap-related, mitochondrial isoform X2 [Sesamum indicum]
MWSALRSRALSSSSSPISPQWKTLLASSSSSSILARVFTSSAVSINETGKSKELLSLAEVEKILNDVGADDVRVIPTPKDCEFTDYMVIATGRSPWHVRNISQALIYKAEWKTINLNSNNVSFSGSWGFQVSVTVKIFVYSLILYRREKGCARHCILVILAN